jgi:hypothetical protein
MLGKAQYDWTELSHSIVAGGVKPFAWYHLKVLAYGCTLVVSSSPSDDPAQSTTVSATDAHCTRAGRIGLRSYATGVSWRNVVVQRATAQDLAAMLALRDAEQTTAAAGPQESKVAEDEDHAGDSLLKTPGSQVDAGVVSRPVWLKTSRNYGLPCLIPPLWSLSAGS